MRTYYEVQRFGSCFDEFFCWHSWLAKVTGFSYNLPSFWGFALQCIALYPMTLLSFFQYPFWYCQQKSFISQLKEGIKREVQQLGDKALLAECRLQHLGAVEYEKELNRERIRRSI